MWSLGIRRVYMHMWTDSKQKLNKPQYTVCSVSSLLRCVVLVPLFPGTIFYYAIYKKYASKRLCNDARKDILAACRHPYLALLETSFKNDVVTVSPRAFLWPRTQALWRSLVYLYYRTPMPLRASTSNSLEIVLNNDVLS